MPSQLKYSSMPDTSKLWCLSLIILLGVGACFGNPSDSQAESPQESFRGSFHQDRSNAFDSAKYNQISPSTVFIESNGGKKYAIYAQFFFNVPPQREYILNGIFVQKHLPEKPKSDDYRRIAQLAWPDAASKDLKSAAKNVEAWIKKNPDKPLLLLCSLRRADFSPMQNHQPIKVSGNEQLTKLIKKIEPVYPQEAMRDRMSGKVVMQITVDEDGAVEQIKLISGHPLLTSAAMEAVQQWKYSPTLLNGEAVPVITIVTVMFGLR
jgi:TonB family protein